MSDRHLRRAQDAARRAAVAVPFGETHAVDVRTAWHAVITRHQQDAETAQARAEAKRARKGELRAMNALISGPVVSIPWSAVLTLPPETP